MTNWTLITVTWNSAAVLQEFWSSVPLPSDVEWIVVDNASSDDSADVARKLGAKVIALETNLGFSAANNRGLRESQSPLIAFVNPDVRVNFSDLPRLAEVVSASGGLVAPQLMNSDGSLQSNGRGWPTLVNKVRNRTLAAAGVEDHYTYYVASEELRYVCWAMGAVVMGDRTVLERLGGWNERFFVYYEDSDFGLRAWANGIPVVVDGASRWVHGWARETSGGFRIRPWLNELSAMTRFYSLYPEMVFGGAPARRKHASANELLGKAFTPEGIATLRSEGDK